MGGEFQKIATPRSISEVLKTATTRSRFLCCMCQIRRRFYPNVLVDIIFGKYEMGRLLGQGTFAKVYHGRNIITNDSVAIKVILKDLVKKAGMMDQIQREISVMSLVHHPNIVELKEVMATKTKIYFVMEYVKGGELFARLLVNEEWCVFVEEVGQLYLYPYELASDQQHHVSSVWDL